MEMLSSEGTMFCTSVRRRGRLEMVPSCIESRSSKVQRWVYLRLSRMKYLIVSVGETGNIRDIENTERPLLETISCSPSCAIGFVCFWGGVMGINSKLI
ncbi:hypothetical protein LINPERPRIM_LOCUS11138 [Linum perenne]